MADIMRSQPLWAGRKHAELLLQLAVVFSLWPKNPQMTQNDDFCVIRGFFPDKKYINLSSQGDMRVESMVI